jgi:hypothetical protein
MPSAVQATIVQRRVATIHRSSVRPERSAPIANANGTASPTYPRYRKTGCATMYGFWRLGLSPFPSAGAAIVSNGLETATSSQVNPTAMPPSTGVTQATRSRARRWANQTASVAYAVSTSSHSRSEPSWPPQKAEILYWRGRSRLEWPAT